MNHSHGGGGEGPPFETGEGVLKPLSRGGLEDAPHLAERDTRAAVERSAELIGDGGTDNGGRRCDKLGELHKGGAQALAGSPGPPADRDASRFTPEHEVSGGRRERAAKHPGRLGETPGANSNPGMRHIYRDGRPRVRAHVESSVADARARDCGAPLPEHAQARQRVQPFVGRYQRAVQFERRSRDELVCRVEVKVGSDQPGRALANRRRDRL